MVGVGITAGLAAGGAFGLSKVLSGGGGQGEGEVVVNNTPGPEETPTNPNSSPTATKKPAATPTQETKVEKPFPFELSWSEEIVGPDITVVLGVEKAVYERPVGNKIIAQVTGGTQTIEQPAIKSLSLSDRYLKQYGINQYPNGMSREDMIKRLNDTVLLGHLQNLQHYDAKYKQITLDDLKKLIHEHKAPTYTIETGVPGENITIDPSKKVSFIMVDSLGLNLTSAGNRYEYHERDGGLIIGSWNAGSYGLGQKDIPQFEASLTSLAFIGGLVLKNVKPISADLNAIRFNSDLDAQTAPLKEKMLPFMSSSAWAGILSPQ